jgi:hypothetical protein
MTDQHRATPEQWEELQAQSQSIWLLASLKMHAQHSCLLELRDRVEALETLHLAVVELNERFSLDPLVARVEALEAAQRPFAVIDTSQWTDEECQRAMESTKEPGRYQPLRVETVYADPSVPVEGIVREVSMTLDEAAAIVAAQRSEQAPADSLVESIEARAGGDARTALRVVAAWLRAEYPRREGYGTAWANMLEQEAEQ